MTDRPRRLAILHDRNTPRGAQHHMVMLISDFLSDLGVEVIHLHGTGRYVPADGIFVHVDLSVVPRRIRRFAQRYPKQINANALDIRKRATVDGLLNRGDSYVGPVIVKSDLNYGGLPELKALTLPGRALRRLRRAVTGQPARNILTKSDYRIFPSLSDVPPEYFTPDNVVQKLILEKDGEKNLLREYMFLGNLHYENIERSSDEIITEDEHISCEPFVPHPRLLRLRRQLNLGYGKIDYVMVNGEPFVFDVNKTMGMGSKGGTEGFGEGLRVMLNAFAEEINRSLRDPGVRAPAFKGAEDDDLEMQEELARFHLDGR
jgi:hypothetical protein